MADDGERKPIPLRGGGPTRKGGPSPKARTSSPVITPPVDLADPQLDPEFRLRGILDMSRRAWEEYEEAALAADDFGVGSMPVGTTDGDLWKARDECRRLVRQTYNRWIELQSQLHRAEQDVRRMKVERPLMDADIQEYEEIRASLRDEYEGLGAHYELLCDNCAALTVRLRRMETSGRDYESQEYTDLHKLYLSYINQLQKYTEAMKTESINKQTQDVALRLIQIFERHFGTAHSKEWNAAMLDIRSTIEEVA